MCLILSVTTDASRRDSLAVAARKAAGLRVEIEHPPRWSWACANVARATISEEGGCACSLLTDDADWNADAWAMRPEILDALVETLRIFAEELEGFSLEAAWAGEPQDCTVEVTIDELVALARSSRLGTRTRYELRPGMPSLRAEE